MALKVDAIYVQARQRKIVNDLSLTVTGGQIVGLLGPNGAGKSTAFYAIAGLIRCHQGGVFIDDLEVTDLPMYRRCQLGLGYLPQECSLILSMTVKENIQGILQLRYPDEVDTRYEKIATDFQLKDIENSQAYQLSGGEKRRVEFARLKGLQPQYILLDEPFAGVDPITISALKTMIRSLADTGIGVLITDHNVKETLAICDHAYLLNDGRVLCQGDSETIIAHPQARSIYLGEDFH